MNCLKKNKEPIKNVEDFKISGILTTEHVVVNNIAIFKENIEINSNVLAKSLVLPHNPMIKFAYSSNYQPSIIPSN